MVVPVLKVQNGKRWNHTKRIRAKTNSSSAWLKWLSHRLHYSKPDGCRTYSWHVTCTATIELFSLQVLPLSWLATPVFLFEGRGDCHDFVGSSLRGKEKTPARSWEQQRSYFPLDRGYLRRGPTLQATSSLLLSLTVKSTDQFTLIVPQSDSVTFSTARCRFDINRIAIMVSKVVVSEH